MQIREESRSYQLESWRGTGFTGPSSLGRGQRPCLNASVCRDDGTKIRFGMGWASAFATNYLPLKLHSSVKEGKEDDPPSDLTNDNAGVAVFEFN